MASTMEDYDREAAWEEQKRIRARFPDLATKPFECMSGWFPLLERMFEDIREAVPHGKEDFWDLRQVKEKFGGLRAYADYASHLRGKSGPEADEADRVRRRVEAAITLAEMRADRTCDVCGSHGWHLIRGGPQGWHMTRCMAHADGGLPTGEPSRRQGSYEYDDEEDVLNDLSGLSLAQLLDLEAGRLEEEIEQALVGHFRGMSDEFDRLGWPDWTDPVPARLRGRVLPWLDVRPHLHYPLKAHKGFHPVNAWTPSWVLTTRRDLNGRPLVISVPREPRPHRQELWS